jgi:hypothetical protein
MYNSKNSLKNQEVYNQLIFEMSCAFPVAMATHAALSILSSAICKLFAL